MRRVLIFVVATSALVAALGATPNGGPLRSKRRSVFERFRSWLDPAAGAKGSNGPIRDAVWVGDGLLAVTGVETTASAGGRIADVADRLRLVDTDDWTYRLLDDGHGVRRHVARPRAGAQHGRDRTRRAG
jgi:hypothetical protein